MIKARRVRWQLLLALLAGICFGTSLGNPLSLEALAQTHFYQTSATGPTFYQQTFAAAAQEMGVPQNILLAVSYNQTRWEQHRGKPSFGGGYGLMHLSAASGQINRGLTRGKDEDSFSYISRSANSLEPLEQAAQLLGVDAEQLKTDPVQNIRGGAALLAQYARLTTGATPASETDWYGAIALYSGASSLELATDFADNVYATLTQGASLTNSEGQILFLPAHSVKPNRQTAKALGLPTLKAANALAVSPDCPPGLACDFIPAAYQTNSDDPTDYGNYDLANRPADGEAIRYIVIHDTEISYNDTLKTYQNSKTYVSTNYVVRSSDGHIAQMVENKNVAYHAGNWYYNMHAIGVEHEGVAIEGASWYNEQLYQSSARLVRYLAAKYNIPLDRAHILGHDEIPGPTPDLQAGMHWDPGPFWDWNHYMQLLGAPIQATPGKTDDMKNKIITISPNFATNQPAMTYCYKDEQSDCRDVPIQSANFVYLHTAPSLDAPLITNPYIKADPTLANNWANKAMSGEQFYLVERQKDWDAIYFGGEKAWFYNPCGAGSVTKREDANQAQDCATRQNSVNSQGKLITPKAGLSSISVYGRAYPDPSVYPNGIKAQEQVPIYTLNVGQLYVATQLVNGDYYYTHDYTQNLEQSDHQLIKDQTQYYEIYFNHRHGFVKASEVDVINA
jgi:N-acetyl-anhydromuramyl-L-alanine amidase AmpD